MAKREHIPEAADGGYWYAVEAAEDPVEGILTPGAIPGAGWCAWYAEIGGVTYAAVRTPEPVTGINTASISVQAVLAQAGYDGKPHGRIRGQ